MLTQEEVLSLKPDQEVILENIPDDYIIDGFHDNEILTIADDKYKKIYNEDYWPIVIKNGTKYVLDPMFIKLNNKKCTCDFYRAILVKGCQCGGS